VGKITVTVGGKKEKQFQTSRVEQLVVFSLALKFRTSNDFFLFLAICLFV